MADLMTTPGARAELISELRSIGLKCTDVAEHLGLTVITLPELPLNIATIGSRRPVCVLMPTQSVLLAVADSDWAIWVGLASALAIDLGIEVDEGTLYEVARVMDRKSGIYLALEIA